MSKVKPFVSKVDKAIHIEPKTKNQDSLLRALNSSPLVVTTGPAGVGKTWCAVNHAVNQLVSGRTTRIVMTRANIPTGRSLGFFPGTIIEKLEPWLAPMISVIKQRLGANDYDNKVRLGQIQLYPLETIRGTSFDDTTLLVDEAQNLTYEEVKALTTRLGENSQIVLMGDPTQSDIRANGLSTLKNIIESQALKVPVVTFTVDDIVRSDLTATLVRAYLTWEQQ